MSTNLRVLVIEDSESDAALLTRELQRTGYDVQAERVDKHDALLGALQRQTWDVVLCDFSMPGFSGANALNLIRQRGLDVPFIFVSGTMGEDVAVEALKAGAHDYVMKSNLQRLVPAVERVLREVQALRQQRLAENALRQSSEQLRRLAAHLQAIREEERASIAREIHDELGQALTGLKMDCAWLAKRLRPDQPDLQQKTEEITVLIDATVQTVRRIATEMRPGVLDDLGLVAAIEWQARDFENRSGIKCELNLAAPELHLDRERSTAVFRIFQEVLTNVVRHANAAQVAVRLAKEDANVVLEVRDDGRGITENEIAAPQSLGILGMRERALVFGGEVSFTGSPSQGTTVRVRIPVGEAGA